MVPAAPTEQRAAVSCLARCGPLPAVRSPCFKPSDFFCFPRAWIGLPGCADFAQPEFAGGSIKATANTATTRHARSFASSTGPLPSDHAGPDSGDTSCHHAKRVRGAAREIENAAMNERAAIIDGHVDAATRIQIGHMDACT